MLYIAHLHGQNSDLFRTGDYLLGMIKHPLPKLSTFTMKSNFSRHCIPGFIVRLVKKKHLLVTTIWEYWISRWLTKWGWSCQVWGAGVSLAQTSPIDSCVDDQNPGGLTAQDHRLSLTRHMFLVFSWASWGGKNNEDEEVKRMLALGNWGAKTGGRRGGLLCIAMQVFHAHPPVNVWEKLKLKWQ